MTVASRGVLKLVTAPKEEPVLLAEAKAFLRVTDSNSDALIQGLVSASRQSLEGRDGRIPIAFLTQTWELVLDAFPRCIELPLAPAQSITSIKYLDAAGVEQTLPAADYRADLASWFARITPAYDKSWPTTYGVIGAVTVRFVAGWTKASEVPDQLKLAVKALVAHFYEHREPVSFTGGVELPLHIDSLIAPYKAWSFA